MLALLKLFLEDFTCDESLTSIRIHDVKLNESIFKNIQDLKAYFKNDIGISDFRIKTTDIQLDIDLDESYNAVYDDLNALIKISKRELKIIVFFTEKGFNKFLESSDFPSEHREIFLFFLDNKYFKAENAIFIRYNEQEIPKIEKKEPIPVVKYVKPLNKEVQAYFTDDILSWIIPEDQKEKFPNCWIHSAFWMLLVSLSTEVYTDNSFLEFQFRGERRKSLILYKSTFEISKPFFLILNECAAWIYSNSKDIDSRHTIFNHQITLLLPDNTINYNEPFLTNLFSNTLENSKLSYRYYLQSNSKELTKTLVDLNKTIFDYISKIRQNTTDLISSLWRDFATVLALLILNFSIKRPELPELFFDFLGIALTVYLVVSIYLNATTNFWFFKNLKKNFQDWRHKIYFYMSEDQIKIHALDPLDSAHKKYKTAFCIVLILYILMIGAVLFFSFKENLFSK